MSAQHQPYADATSWTSVTPGSTRNVALQFASRCNLSDATVRRAALILADQQKQIIGHVPDPRSKLELRRQLMRINTSDLDVLKPRGPERLRPPMLDRRAVRIQPPAEFAIARQHRCRATHCPHSKTTRRIEYAETDYDCRHCHCSDGAIRFRPPRRKKLWNRRWPDPACAASRPISRSGAASRPQPSLRTRQPPPPCTARLASPQRAAARLARSRVHPRRADLVLPLIVLD